MRYNLFLYSFLAIISFENILCWSINIISRNQALSVRLDSSDSIINSVIQIRINGDTCFQSENFIVDQSFRISSSTPDQANGCSKLTATESVIVDTSSVQFKFTFAFTTGSMYTVHIYKSGVIYQSQMHIINYESEPVQNLIIRSAYPNDPMILTWNPPTVSNGQIIQYIVVVKNPSDNKCLFWFTTNCSDCTNKIAGLNNVTNSLINCEQLTFTNTFSTNLASITVSPFSNVIFSNTIFSITVIPVNTFGWGLTQSITVTSPYPSGTVTNLIKTSSYPTDPMKLTWTKPEQTNGIITQYIVVVQDPIKDTCLFWFVIVCSDCGTTSAGSMGDTNIRYKCSEITHTYTFTNVMQQIVVSPVSSLITANTNYKITVFPINGYGWGSGSSIISMNPFTSNPVRDLIMTSVYPNDPLKLSWKPPLVSTGYMVHYIVLVLNSITGNCMLWFTLDCNNCPDQVVGSTGDTGIRTGCTNIANVSSYKLDSDVSVSPKSPLIAPNTPLKVSVVPQNGYGWGTIETVVQTTPFISEPVINLIVTSSYPKDPMKLTWAPPSKPYGEIIQYLVMVQNPTDDKCIFWLTTLCSDCANNVTGSLNELNTHNGCTKLEFLSTFKITSTSITVSISSALITPKTQFKISVIPINGYGWGTPSTKIMTTPFTSGPITQFIATSYYVADAMKLTWTPPGVPNGAITQYIIIVQNPLDNTCLFWFEANCNDCPNNVVGTMNEKNLHNGCTKITYTNTFSTSLQSVSVSPSSSIIKTKTKYNILVVPVNGYGWGPELLGEITTTYKLGPVSNLVAKNSFSNDKLKLTWTPPTINDGHITQYLIVVQDQANNNCLYWFTTLCSNCPRTVVGNGDHDNIRTGCEEITFSGTFLKDSTSITVSPTSTLIIAKSKVKITVTPLNPYGHADKSVIMHTIPFTSQPVTNLKVTHTFTNATISLEWQKPSEPNGEIGEYLVLVEHPFNDNCILWFNTICNDCINNIVGTMSDTNIKSRCAQAEFNKTFSTNLNLFSASITSSSIQPNTLYKISVIPINGYGWGTPVTVIQTTPYTSEPVTDLNMTNTFPNDPMKLTWTRPSTPYGEIVQYIVVVQNNNNCKFWFTTLCSDCTNNLFGTNDDTNIRTGCPQVAFTNTFSTTSSSITVSPSSELINGGTQYNISVIPLNAYGWGKVSSITPTTSLYTSRAVASLFATSSYPTDPMTLTLVPPVINHGQILQYIVVVQNPTDNKCIFWFTISCSDCTPNVIGNSNETNIRDKCTEVTNNYKFLSSATSISVSPSSPLTTSLLWYRMLCTNCTRDADGTISEAKISANCAKVSFNDTDSTIITASPSTPLITSLFWFTVLCNDCTYVDGKINENNIRTNCTKVTFNNTFPSSSVSIQDSALINSENQFKISVIPLNGYGWGILSSIDYHLPYKSGPVTGLSMTNKYPNDPLKLTWNANLAPVGLIVQYIVVVQDSENNTCRFWFTILCSDCSHNVVGTLGVTINQTGCNEITFNDKFSKSWPSITVSPLSDIITPSTAYNVSVIPVNGYGWGNISSITGSTGASTRDPVPSLGMTSLYPNDPMKLSWTQPPGRTNKYFVVVQNPSDSKCLFWFGTSCNDCSPNTVGTAGDTGIRNGCDEIGFSETFSTDSKSITASPTSTKITPNTAFHIVLVSVNENGWGTTLKLNQMTSANVGPVTTLEMTSLYPSEPMKLTWTQLTGRSNQYIVVVQNPSDSKCLFWFATSCSDCSPNVIGTFGDTGIKAGCQDVTFTHTFSSTSQQITMSYSSTVITPKTQFKISVIPVNEYGWGIISTIAPRTSPNVGPVTSVAMTSQYPNDPMKLSWTQPDGRSNQYIVVAQNPSDSKCLFWFATSCRDCTPDTIGTFDDTGIRAGCIKIGLNYIFSTNLKSLTVSPVSSLITPKTKFNLLVIPVNEFGWGVTETITVTTPFTSEPVTNIIMTSSYPIDPMKLTWVPPSVPNGQIVQYNVVVQNPNDGKCVFLFTTKCSDCTNNLIGTMDDTKIKETCQLVTISTTFVNDLKAFVVSPSSALITPNTTFKISVIPLNGYGWGTLLSINQTTPFTSGSVTNLIMTSSYPSDPMKLSWTVPLVTYGQIVQYIVVVQNTTNDKCVFWFTTLCSDCTNDIFGTMDDTKVRDGCTEVLITTKYSIALKSITVSPFSQLITGNTAFKVSVIPLNGYGWGNHSTITQKTPFTSQPVTKLFMTSSFPYDPIKLTWTPPSVTYGKIVQYIVLVQKSTDDSCLFWFTTLCSDCTNNIFGTMGDTKIRTGCPQVTFNITFSTNFTSITVSPLSVLITPKTLFKISVVPLNGYGWGTPATITQLTPFKSETISKFTLTTSFPSAPLNLNWIPPSVNNGEIIQYVILVQNTSNGYCGAWVVMICSDCLYNVIGSIDETNIRSNCFKIEYSTKYLTASTSISVSLPTSSMSLIYPNTEYNISVVSVNGYGWGHRSSIITTTSQYISGSVKALTATSLYPNWLMNLTWIPPSVNNGEIMQYIVLLQNVTNYGCVAWLPTNCDDCANNIIGNKGDTNIRTGCQILDYSIKFSKKSRSISVSLASSYSLLLFHSSYNISVIPVNGYGWGYVSSIIQTTDRIKLSGFENDTIKEVIITTKQTPNAYQIPVTLPFSFIKQSDGINKVKLLVSVTGKTANTHTAEEKTYSQCNKGLDCAYVIWLSLPASNNLRRKRDTSSTGSMYSNVEFMIGNESYCNISCNGPLIPSTTYDIGFRMCSSVSCRTITIQKSTSVDWTTIIILVVIILVVILLATIIPATVIVVLRRRDNKLILKQKKESLEEAKRNVTIGKF